MHPSGAKTAAFGTKLLSQVHHGLLLGDWSDWNAALGSSSNWTWSEFCTILWWLLSQWHLHKYKIRWGYNLVFILIGMSGKCSLEASSRGNVYSSSPGRQAYENHLHSLRPERLYFRIIWLDEPDQLRQRLLPGSHHCDLNLRSGIRFNDNNWAVQAVQNGGARWTGGYATQILMQRYCRSLRCQKHGQKKRL